MTSPYLNLPIRTEAEARAEIEERRMIECPLCEGQGRAFTIDRWDGCQNFNDNPCPRCGWAGEIEADDE